MRSRCWAHEDDRKDEQKDLSVHGLWNRETDGDEPLGRVLSVLFEVQQLRCGSVESRCHMGTRSRLPGAL